MTPPSGNGPCSPPWSPCCWRSICWFLPARPGGLVAGVGRLDPLLVRAGRGLQRPALVVAEGAGPAAGREAALAFLTGYVVEWSLSMDNVFVFAVIFRFFQVPPQYQYRVLFWGILGAIVLRLGFVLAGVQLIRHFDWVLPLFGLLLVYTAVKLAVHAESEVQPEKNVVLRFARRWLPRQPGRPSGARPRLLCPSGRPVLHHAAVSGPAGGGEQRHRVCGGQRAGHPGHDH